MASKQQQAFMMCVLPCPRYLMGRDTHNLCVACLGEEHICRIFPLRKILRYASLTDAPIPPGVLSRGRSGSRSGETGAALSMPSPDRFSASYQGWEACTAVSSTTIEAHTLQLSNSEELEAANARTTEDSPPQFRAYEELVEVVTSVVEK